ncbi:MAG: hypothetical protein ACRCX8_00550 [Sarcina sp.]
MNFKKYFQEKKKIKKIKRNFAIIIRELHLFNSIGEYPDNLDLKFSQQGFELTFSISGICDYSKIENNLNFIACTFKALQVEFINNRGTVTLKIYIDDLELLEYQYINLNETELLLGYNFTGTITADMRKSAHLLISGLSNNGKTGLLRVLIKNIQYNKKADVVICNAFKDDFKDFSNIRFIDYEESIKVFLESILSKPYKREKPLFIVLEELMTIKDKKLIDIIKQLLAVARHFNIYIIGIIQIATKENCTFKDLFNSRVSFKQIDDSSYRVALGVSVDKYLKEREFYLFSENGLMKGKTFNLDF